MSSITDAFYELRVARKRNVAQNRVKQTTQQYVERYENILDGLRTQGLQEFISEDFRQIKSELNELKAMLNRDAFRAREMSLQIGQRIHALSRLARQARNIEVENKIYNYVLKYLEKTYGVKNLKRPYPTNKNAKLFLAKDVLIPKILKDLYGLSKWDGKKVGIHSQALRDEYLVSILTNFGEHRKI